jgi:plasmid maintenance system antidote protein VapI
VNRIVTIGFLGSQTCYLNVSREEALRRYLEENNFYSREEAQCMLREFQFEDSFEVYDVFPKDSKDWTLSQFEPDWASPPGDTIKDLLEEKGMSKEKLSELLGVERVDDLLSGAMRIDWSLAHKLERVFGSTWTFWMNRDEQYQADLARLNAKEDKKNAL